MSQQSIDFTKQAEQHANEVHEGWTEKALSFLESWVSQNSGEFMGEDIRNAAKWIVPEPPSKRAWGAIMLKAAKKGLIRSIGTRKVKNEKAHNAIATLWTKV